VTVEEWAPYGVGTPDADGWYPDYRLPPELLAAPPDAAPSTEAAAVDGSWLAIVQQWRLVIADLQLHVGIDLYDPAVLARPMPGLRTAILSLLDHDTRLRRSLTRR